MGFLDDVLDDVEQQPSTNGRDKKKASFRGPETHDTQISSFQRQLQKRAKLQMEKFRQKVERRVLRFKDSADNQLSFPNEPDEQRRFVIHDVADQHGLTTRDEDPPEFSTVKLIVVYKEAPPEVLDYDDLSINQKIELERRMNLQKRKRKKKREDFDATALAKGLKVAMPKYKPKDTRTTGEILRQIREKRKREAEAKKTSSSSAEKATSRLSNSVDAGEKG
eukprot:CAMPEP_0114525812 /NCGR_PEP_ID=MMETSP0109-20121206/22646_1 /TAXON_ID=29199 /ORGANISM="Chlorarachnion reptans, Strain CCCM449" /LENGTH=221 /DNA_ID=CAMNT_0001707463 /DNA_START=91 /DNA_END=756 /DNA_ORIENTATION=+